MNASSKFPRDWDFRLLDEVAKRGSGHTPSKAHPAYWNGGVKWVSLADSGKLDQGLIHATAKEISAEGLAHSSAVLHPAGTVVLSRDAGVGKSAILAEPMAVSQHFMAWQCDNATTLHNWFLYYWLQFQKREFERQAIGSTIVTIGLPYFRRLRMPLPVFVEQVKIAKVLGSCDAAIRRTTNLITLHQRMSLDICRLLLTGRLRFPEFGKPVRKGAHHPDGWLSKQIDEVFSVRSDRGCGHETVLSVTQDCGVVPRDALARKINMSRANTAAYKLVFPGDFIISLRSFQGGLEYSQFRGIVSPAYHVLTPRVAITPGYFRHFFKSVLFLELLKPAIIGIRDGKQISLPQFFATQISFPEIPEQKRIADMLDKLELEINLLTRQAQALQTQKEGLMQQLLTGKIRVKV